MKDNGIGLCMSKLLWSYVKYDGCVLLPNFSSVTCNLFVQAFLNTKLQIGSRIFFVFTFVLFKLPGNLSRFSARLQDRDIRAGVRAPKRAANTTLPGDQYYTLGLVGFCFFIVPLYLGFTVEHSYPGNAAVWTYT